MNKPQPIGRASQTAQASGPAPRKLRAGRPIGLKGEDVPPFSGNAAPAPKIDGQPSKPALARPSRSDGAKPDSAAPSGESNGGDLRFAACANLKRRHR